MNRPQLNHPIIDYLKLILLHFPESNPCPGNNKISQNQINTQVLEALLQQKRQGPHFIFRYKILLQS